MLEYQSSVDPIQYTFKTAAWLYKNRQESAKIFLHDKYEILWCYCVIILNVFISKLVLIHVF